MSQPAHPDYPKKSYYMVITGYPKYGLPAVRPHWIPSYMWSQMQALQHRGIDVANDLNDDNVYDSMTSDIDDELLDDAIVSESDWQNDEFWDLMEKTMTR